MFCRIFSDLVSLYVFLWTLVIFKEWIFFLCEVDSFVCKFSLFPLSCFGVQEQETALQATTYTLKKRVEVPGSHISSSPWPLQLLILITPKLSFSDQSRDSNKAKGREWTQDPAYLQESPTQKLHCWPPWLLVSQVLPFIDLWLLTGSGFFVSVFYSLQSWWNCESNWRWSHPGEHHRACQAGG